MRYIFSIGRWAAAGLLPFLLFTLTACSRPEAVATKSAAPQSLIVSENPENINLRLPDGAISVVPKHPRRTAILLTSLLDLWVEAGGEVVARCQGKADLPPQAMQAVVVGAFNHPNLEKLVAMRPDLVITSDVGNYKEIIPILKQNKIAYAVFSYNNYHDYIRIAEVFAKLNGTEKHFQSVYDKMTAKVEEIASTCRKYPSPKVLIIFTTSHSVTCELPNSQTGVMLTMLGARNIIPAEYQIAGKTRIDFSLEHIVALDPDIILLNTMGDMGECRARLSKEFGTNAAWSSLRAIRTGRFYVLPKELFHYKPNGNFPKALAYLAKTVYPELDQKPAIQANDRMTENAAAKGLN